MEFGEVEAPAVKILVWCTLSWPVPQWGLSQEGARHRKNERMDENKNYAL